MRQRHTGLTRVLHATRHSFAGLRTAYAGESAFRQEVWLAVVLVPLAFLLGRDWIEVAVLAGCTLQVLVVELLNTGIESVVDRVSADWHELSKRAKDLGSAAVFVSLLLCAGIWLAALWHVWAPATRSAS
jgi:diacylglycerol kinase (ATP)